MKTETYSNEERWLKIYNIIAPMGFTTKGNGLFKHRYFGDDVVFDLSASHDDNWAVMSNIFAIIIEFGKDEKAKEFRKMLNIQ